MNKFYGAVGFGVSEEKAAYVYDQTIVERMYSGDILQFSRQFEKGEGLNDNLNISNKISILGDPYAYENFANIRYVSWMGTLWKVSSIEVNYPRLILAIGGVYNGPNS